MLMVAALCSVTLDRMLGVHWHWAQSVLAAFLRRT